MGFINEERGINELEGEVINDTDNHETYCLKYGVILFQHFQDFFFHSVKGLEAQGHF